MTNGDYVANSGGTGDDSSGLVLHSASEISNTHVEVSAGVTGEMKSEFQL